MIVKPPLHLFRIRAQFPDTSEADPAFVMARHEEGAAILYFTMHARDMTDQPGLELDIEMIADASSANPE